MATAATTSYPYADDQMSVAQWREWAKTCSGRTSGVVAEGLMLEPFGDSTGMQVKVRSGKAHLEGSYGSWTSTTTLAISSAPVTAGWRRIDRIITRSDLTGGRMELDVLIGTAVNGSTTPTPPALTNDSDTIEQSIGQVFVTQGTASVTAGMVTDERSFARGVGADSPGKIIWRAATPGVPTAVPFPGYLWCDGSAVSRITYAELFATISTYYGAGDGSTTFNVPDYRGEVLAAWDNLGSGAAGRLPSVTSPTGHYGEDTHTFVEDEIPNLNWLVSENGDNAIWMEVGNIKQDPGGTPVDVILPTTNPSTDRFRTNDATPNPFPVLQPTHGAWVSIAARPA